MTAVSGIAERLRDARCHGRANLQCSRHVFQGEPTYILRDPVTFETHRLSRDDYHIFSRLTDDITLGELFDELRRDGRVAASQEAAFYQFVVRLQQQGLLSLPGNAAPLYQNHVKRSASQRVKPTKLFFLRVPLLNPDALLQRTIHLFRPLFSRPAAIAWTGLMVACLVLLASQWAEFVHPLSNMLQGHTFFIAWGTLLGLKVVHEFGHAYACKHFGGDVPEMGAYFIVFNPCAYMDASDAWGMPSRWRRIVVSLGGMYFESLVGAAALIVWTLTDAGAVRDVAHHLVVMSTTVTILFNANPLLRYDGYFILCDLWGRPNLRREAIAEALALLKYLALGLPRNSQEPSKFNWGLVCYGSAASIYKLTVVVALSMIVSRRFLWLGIGMATMYGLQTVGANLWRATKYLLFSEETRSAAIVRWRARCACMALLSLPWLVLMAPVPGGVVAPGTLARRSETSVYVRNGGVLQHIAVAPGDTVQPNQSLAQLESDLPKLELEQADAQWIAARQEQAVLLTQGAEAAQTTSRVQFLQDRMAAAAQQERRLRVPSPVGGEVVSIISSKQLGAFLPQGERLATVANGPWTARVLVTESQMVKMKPRVGMAAYCQLDAIPQRRIPGTVTMVAVHGAKQVRDPRLTQLGGGGIAVVAGGGAGVATLGTGSGPVEHIQNEVHYESLASYYEVEIVFDRAAMPEEAFHGMKLKTRFNTEGETLGGALRRRLHRLWESMQKN